jgi:hypothetical protein
MLERAADVGEHLKREVSRGRSTRQKRGRTKPKKGMESLSLRVSCNRKLWSAESPWERIGAEPSKVPVGVEA